jgi:hypothetical protein
VRARECAYKLQHKLLKNVFIDHIMVFGIREYIYSITLVAGIFHYFSILIFSKKPEGGHQIPGLAPLPAPMFTCDIRDNCSVW